MIGSVPPCYSTAQESRLTRQNTCTPIFDNGDNDSVFGNCSAAASNQAGTLQLSQNLSPGFEDPPSCAVGALFLFMNEDLPNSPVDAVSPSWYEYYPSGFENPRYPLSNGLNLPAYDQHSSTGTEGFQNPPADTRQLSYDQSYSREFENFPVVIDAFQPFAYNQSSFPGVENFHFLPNTIQLAAARQIKSSLAQTGQKKRARADRTGCTGQANPSLQWVVENGPPKRIRRATVGGRTKQSCDQCRRKHGKCNGKRPSCGPCEKEGWCCSYTQKPHKKVREERE
ncbi:hypothetical protein BC936DRAFT_136819 [Jimgerdemannia flammicorona]|uniref:Zn(2)-C6 fungal-type domain-containing protein n=1 Tax=Jimgerdemannia flammicorona TaxID=994334 RepID=A0A433DJC4_9FUNG|nr:hypothetical protein BC936DRAFT_136819 [Jimgerdemannia flammicorona]